MLAEVSFDTMARVYAGYAVRYASYKRVVDAAELLGFPPPPPCRPARPGPKPWSTE